MKYSSLNKNELKQELDNRKIWYQSSMKKDELIEILIKDDVTNELKESNVEQNIQNTSNNSNVIEEKANTNNQKMVIDKFGYNSQAKENGIGKAGAILSIIGSVIVILFLWWTIIFLIGGISSLISSINHVRGKHNKVMAGVLALIFSGIIGGILILVGNNNER